MSEEEQTCRVYVGNIDWKVTWQDLKDHMRGPDQELQVAFADIFEEASGRSKGCAIVEYESSEDAKVAAESLNDTMLGDRLIFVREDRETTRAKGKSRGGGKGYGGYGGYQSGKGGGKYGGKYGKPALTPLKTGPRDKGRLVYVGNLPWRAAWQDIKDLFRECGEVIRVDVATDPLDGRSKGYATVLFDKEEDAQKAIEELNETDFQGRRLLVRLDKIVG
mmetsp:Transcript_158004/g.278964  ORF Transcript_158004/g.278964 Transcript_158004/m.278964 type:complete len:220 (-) Transcript_158004:104-763(-)